MLHDMLPSSHMDYLIPMDLEPQGKIYQFFSKKDSSTTARQKWYCAIKNDYKRFYEILLGTMEIEDVSIRDAVMMYDVFGRVRTCIYF